MNNEINEKKLKKIIHSLSLKHNFPFKDFQELVNSPYEFTKEIIKNKNFKDIEKEEDLEDQKINFIYKYIGKLYTTLYRIKSKNKQYERAEEYKRRTNSENS